MTTLKSRPGMVSLIIGALVFFCGEAVVGATHGFARGGGVLWYPPLETKDTASQAQVPTWAEIRPLPTSTVRLGQIVRLPYRTGRAGYAHLFFHNPDGSFVTAAVNQRVAAGRWQEFRMGVNAAVVARGPTGRTHITLVVTDGPLDSKALPVTSVVGLQSILASVHPSSWTIARTHVDVWG